MGYGCTTCIGNSGPLPESVSKEITANGLVVAAVLSGNRNFEGRVHGEVRANYLASPPLVVAYALAGRVDIDFDSEPLGADKAGEPVFLRDIWPSQQEVIDTVHASVKEAGFRKVYSGVYEGDRYWQALDVPKGNLYQWSRTSTYVSEPPYFSGMTRAPRPVGEITGRACWRSWAT